MARIKIQLPGNSYGCYQIPVRITDVNYGNHVGNNAIVEIIHEARVQFLKENNFTELNAGGVGLIMNDLQVEYKNEAFYPDVLSVDIFVGEITKKTFELYYRLITERDGDVITIAQAKTGMVCYDYSAKKVVLIPQVLKNILI
jgi:YbgC/YbaW family acyl-CoA thioester hydrolase